MRQKGILVVTGFLIVILFCSHSNAQSQQITKGLEYLYNAQNPDGSWSGTLHRGTFSTTVNVIETLSVLGQEQTAAYTKAVSWLQAQELEATEQLSDRIHALPAAGNDSDLLVSYREDMTGAWGGYGDYDINNLDTSMAVRALKKIDHQDQDMMYEAVDYLIGMQNADGGWGFKEGMESEAYYTAIISKTLQQFPRAASIAAAIDRATDYLLAHQSAEMP